jgi:hypothetical protein
MFGPRLPLIGFQKKPLCGGVFAAGSLPALGAWLMRV